MNKLTPLSLFIINQVRFRRFILGLSSRNLSTMLDHSTGYVGMIESKATQDQYPPHEWPKLAEALHCSVHDLLPAGQTNSTGELVDKVVLSLGKEEDLKLVLEGLIDYGFFDRQKTAEEIIKHLEIQNNDQKELLLKVLSDLVHDGYLKQRVEHYYREIV